MYAHIGDDLDMESLQVTLIAQFHLEDAKESQDLEAERNPKQGEHPLACMAIFENPDEDFGLALELANLQRSEGGVGELHSARNVTRGASA